MFLFGEIDWTQIITQGGVGGLCCLALLYSFCYVGKYLIDKVGVPIKDRHLAFVDEVSESIKGIDEALAAGQVTSAKRNENVVLAIKEQTADINKSQQVAAEKVAAAQETLSKTLIAAMGTICANSKPH